MYAVSTQDNPPQLLLHDCASPKHRCAVLSSNMHDPRQQQLHQNTAHLMKAPPQLTAAAANLPRAPAAKPHGRCCRQPCCCCPCATTTCCCEAAAIHDNCPCCACCCRNTTCRRKCCCCCWSRRRCCCCSFCLDQQAALAEVHAVQELADVLVLHQALLVDQGSGPGHTVTQHRADTNAVLSGLPDS